MLILSFISIFCCKIIFFNKKNSRYFLSFSVVTLFLLSIMRTPEEGVDIPTYIGYFYRLAALSLGEVLLLGASGELRDPVFWLITVSMAKLGLGHWFWISSISFLFFFSVWQFLQKYSTFPLLSLVLLISLGYVGFSYSGLRQTVALSLVLISLSFLLEGRKAWFIAGVYLASLFHFSAIASILFIFLNYKLRLHHYFLGIGFSLFSGVFLESQLRAVIGMAGEQYSGYIDRDVALNFTGVLICFSVLVFCLSRFKQVNASWPYAPILYNGLLIGFGFQCLSLILAEMFRVAMYFNIVSVILVGWVLTTYESGMFRSAVYLSILSACVALFFVSKI